MTLRQIGNYRLDSLLGTGGMGEVYKAYDTYRDRFVALKLLPQDSPDGRYLFTANNQDSTLTVINTANNRVIAEIPIGISPTSIGLLSNGRQAYVADENSGSIEVLTLPA